MARKNQIYRYAVVMYQQDKMIFSRFIMAQSLKDAEGFMAYVFPLYQQIAGAVDGLANIDRFKVVRMSKKEMPQYYNIFDIEDIICSYSHSEMLKKFIYFLIYGTF
jgi:hypothetical protein